MACFIFLPRTIGICSLCGYWGCYSCSSTMLMFLCESRTWSNICHLDLQPNHNWIELITRIVCIRPKGRTQCIFPRSQHTCLYIYWPKVNLYQVVLGQQSFWTLFKSLAQLFCKCFFFVKWPPVAILESLLAISDQYHNLNFCDFVHEGHHIVFCPGHEFLVSWSVTKTFFFV